MTLAEQKKDSVYTYMTEVEHEIFKQNTERLMKENLELRHRLACIADDIEIIDRHIQNNCNKKFKRQVLMPMVVFSMQTKHGIMFLT